MINKESARISNSLEYYFKFSEILDNCLDDNCLDIN